MQNLKMRNLKLVVVAHTSNSSILRHRQKDLCELEANLVYIVSSRQPALHSESLPRSGLGSSRCEDPGNLSLTRLLSGLILRLKSHTVTPQPRHIQSLLFNEPKNFTYMKLSNKSLKEFQRTLCMCVQFPINVQTQQYFVPQSLQAGLMFSWYTLFQYISQLWPVLLWLPGTHIMLVIQDLEQHPGYLSCRTQHSVNVGMNGARKEMQVINSV